MVCPGHVGGFTRWIDGQLAQADIVMAYSRATAGEVVAHAARRAIDLPGPIRVVPLGTGLTEPPALVERPARLPPVGSYVLFVSTLEPRKNHAFAITVWEHLLATMPRERVPKLVLAGRPTAQMAPLIERLRATEHLDGHVIHFADASDLDLVALYQGCLFTFFPSLYEGWGLPVTESLVFGKPCFAAANSSLPEAGGAFARYFDTDRPEQTAAMLRAAIEDPAGLTEWEAGSALNSRPVSWRQSARRHPGNPGQRS